MEFELNFDNFLALSGLSALFSGVFAVLLKAWLQHSFNGRLSKLEMKNQMLTHEHQVRFTRLDEKVTTAIEGGYEIVCDYSDAIKDLFEVAYGDDDVTGIELEAELKSVGRRFNRYMQRQSIYLPLDLKMKMDAVYRELSGAYAQEVAVLRKNKEKTTRTILVDIFHKHSIREKLDSIVSDLQLAAHDYLSKFSHKD